MKLKRRKEIFVRDVCNTKRFFPIIYFLLPFKFCKYFLLLFVIIKRREQCVTETRPQYKIMCNVVISKKEEINMALNSNQITIWKDKNNIKTIGTGSIKDENGNYTNFSLSEVYTKDGKMLGLGLNMQVALYYPAEGKKFALNTNYKQPINVKTTTDLLQRFDKKISVAFKNPGDESAGKSANYNLVFNDPKDKKQDGLAF